MRVAGMEDLLVDGKTGLLKMNPTDKLEIYPYIKYGERENDK